MGEVLQDLRSSDLLGDRDTLITSWKKLKKKKKNTTNAAEFVNHVNWD